MSVWDRFSAQGRTVTQSVDLAVAVFASLVRAGLAMQILQATWHWRLTRYPSAYLFWSLLCVGFLIGYSVWAVRRGSVHSRPVVLFDAALGLVALISMAVLVPGELLVNTWISWGPAFCQVSICVCMVGWWRRSLAVCHVLVVTLTYALVCQAAVGAGWTLIAGNTLNYLVFGLACRLGAGFLRWLAAEGDRARALAATNARLLELERAQLLVHDATGILRQLGDPDTPAAMLPALRAQAVSESRRLRRHLLEAEPWADPDSLDLPEVVRRATAGFEDLSLEISTGLATGTPLPQDVALAVQRAVTTALHNVRQHAAAQRVVIHADRIDANWELVVRDDGVGFDPDREGLGFGLRTQVLDALSKVGARGRVESAPDLGTAVIMEGRAAR